jgi:hypothetical protein
MYFIYFIDAPLSDAPETKLRGESKIDGSESHKLLPSDNIGNMLPYVLAPPDLRPTFFQVSVASVTVVPSVLGQVGGLEAEVPCRLTLPL